MFSSLDDLNFCITVEDPTASFQRVRDYVDALNCSTLPSYSRENLLKGYDKTMMEEARDKFKINKVIALNNFNDDRFYSLHLFTLVLLILTEAVTKSVRDPATELDRRVKRERLPWIPIGREEAIERPVQTRTTQLEEAGSCYVASWERHQCSTANTWTANAGPW